MGRNNRDSLRIQSGLSRGTRTPGLWDRLRLSLRLGLQHRLWLNEGLGVLLGMRLRHWSFGWLGLRL
jgi:hypothetical protein